MSISEAAAQQKNIEEDRPVITAIVGGGGGCEAILRMVQEDSLSRFRMAIRGVADINPDAPIVTVSYGKIPEKFLDGIRHIVRAGQGLLEPPQAVFSATFRSDKPVERERFFDAIDSLRDNVLRMKGYIDFGEGAVFVERVGDEMIEKSAPPDKKGTSFVVIAWNIREQELRDRIDEILT